MILDWFMVSADYELLIRACGQDLTTGLSTPLFRVPFACRVGGSSRPILIKILPGNRLIALVTGGCTIKNIGYLKAHWIGLNYRRWGPGALILKEHNPKRPYQCQCSNPSIQVPFRLSSNQCACL